MLASSDVWSAPAAARLAGGWVGIVALATALTLAGALFGLVGVWPRVGFGVAACAGTLALGAHGAAGAPVHTHHLVWMTAILALSPCGDAWAPGRSAAPPSGRHAAAVLALYAVLGLVYFGPGLHKWVGDWSGVSVTHHLWWKWAQAGQLPSVRPDRSTALVGAGAAAVVAVELWAPVGLVWRRTRMATVAALWAFHAVVWAIAFIPFTSLAAALAVALPVGRPASDWRITARDLLPWAVVVPVFAAALHGGTAGWPFACYPTFDADPGDVMPVAIVEAWGADGHRRIDVPARPAQRDVGVAWRVTGVVGGAPRAERDRLAARWLCPLAPGAVVDVYAGARSVRPEDVGDPPVRGVLRARATCPG